MSALPQYKVTLCNVNYFQDGIRCQSACPVGTDACGYIRAIAEGDYETAYLIARGPNPLASICGCVCGAPCELSCRRGDTDKPVAIRALKRFVCEKFGPETRASRGEGLIDYLRQAAARHTNRPCCDKDDLLGLLQSLLQQDLPLVKNKSVGIIGSGPAGLAAAHDLALLGFDTTIYEMESVLAGMLTLGIPEYRLARTMIRAEVDVILELGVKGGVLNRNCELVGNDLERVLFRPSINAAGFPRTKQHDPLKAPLRTDTHRRRHMQLAHSLPCFFEPGGKRHTLDDIHHQDRICFLNSLH